MAWLHFGGAAGPDVIQAGGDHVGECRRDHAVTVCLHPCSHRCLHLMSLHWAQTGWSTRHDAGEAASEEARNECHQLPPIQKTPHLQLHCIWPCCGCAGDELRSRLATEQNLAGPDHSFGTLAVNPTLAPSAPMHLDLILRLGHSQGLPASLIQAELALDFAKPSRNILWGLLISALTGEGLGGITRSLWKLWGVWTKVNWSYWKHLFLLAVARSAYYHLQLIHQLHSFLNKDTSHSYPCPAHVPAWLL